MKKTTLLFVFALVVVFAVGAQQYDDEGDFRVTVVGGGAVEIARYIGEKQNVNIPPAMGGLPVVGIGERAFEDTEVVSVTIPSGVTYIGEGAFYEWGAGQTIRIEGYADQESADAVWGEGWREECEARIEYMATIDIFPAKNDFFEVWVNGLEVRHIISGNEWTFLSPNGNTYTMSNLVWKKAANRNTALSSDYLYGYEIAGTVVRVAYNSPTYIATGMKSTVSYFLHDEDKTKIMADNDPAEAAFYSKVSD
jgi:hypothetical protein